MVPSGQRLGRPGGGDEDRSQKLGPPHTHAGIYRAGEFVGACSCVAPSDRGIHEKLMKKTRRHTSHSLQCLLTRLYRARWEWGARQKLCAYEMRLPGQIMKRMEKGRWMKKNAFIATRGSVLLIRPRKSRNDNKSIM